MLIEWLTFGQPGNIHCSGDKKSSVLLCQQFCDQERFFFTISIFKVSRLIFLSQHKTRIKYTLKTQSAHPGLKLSPRAMHHWIVVCSICWLFLLKWKTSWTCTSTTKEEAERGRDTSTWNAKKPWLRRLQQQYITGKKTLDETQAVKMPEIEAIADVESRPAICFRLAPRIEFPAPPRPRPRHSLSHSIITMARCQNRN